MWQWLMLAAATLYTAPVRLSLRVDIGEKPSFAMVAYVYNLRFSLNGPITLDVGILAAQGPINLSPKEIFLFFYHLFMGAVWSEASVSCCVGTGDACTTALATGLAAGMLRMAGAPMGMRVTVRPEFGRPFFALSLRCILFFRGGDIILAGMKALAGRRPMKRKVEMANGEASH